MISRLALLLIAWFGLNSLVVAVEPAENRGRLDFFERKIRPLLSKHCYSCHSADSKTLHGGLLLDSSSGISSGGDSGPVFLIGKPDESLLLQAVRYEGGLEMPPQGKLSEREIEHLSNWIRNGAVLPNAQEETSPARKGIDYEQGRQFWSFQGVQQYRAPPVNHATWPVNTIDTFVLAAMEREGLSPSPQADRATLLRRLSFATTGLPPTPEQIRQFAADDSPDAYQKWVERFLSSPEYGEHWGRWWLDKARYTDRTASWLYQTGQSYFYRDWVVQALNDDMPYDEFVRRQLATDLMPETGPEDLPALGFISLSPTYWKELKLPCDIIKTIVADEWEERVDAVSRTFLGLTVACARCHDHKFDPVSSEDYYALAGIFASCRQVERPMISDDAFEPVRIAREKVAKLESEIATLRKKKPLPKTELDALAREVADIKTATPLFDTPMANALSEESLFVVPKGKNPQEGTVLEYRSEPRDLPAFIRGNPNRPGPVVPRRFLKVLSTSTASNDPESYRNGSGRLELAESIVGDAAPLSARVMVNRVWQAQFGRGIVDTPSNFGQQGNRPTHSKLLDDLAARFIAGGWSIKQLQREILLSATWRQRSVAGGHHRQIDPDNRWLWRMNRRRLTFEQWRDAALACVGNLDLAKGGPSIDLEAASNHRRTLYATVHRRDMSPTMMIHDFPDPTQHNPKRNSTVTPLQGLYVLNGPLLIGQSKKLAERRRILAERWTSESAADTHRQISDVYQVLYSREPTKSEIDAGLAFLRSGKADDRTNRWQQYAHVLLAANEFMFVD